MNTQNADQAQPDRKSTDELLDRLADTAAAVRPLASAEVLPLRTSFNLDRMEDLEAAVRKPIAVPHVGEAAANAVQVCFDTVAKDIVRVAQEHVDRANRQLEEAEALAASLRSTGNILCDRVRSETIRGAKVSEVMRIAAQVINEPMTTDHVETDGTLPAKS